MTTNIILLGPPNSGKSTLAQKILKGYPEMRRFNVGAYFLNEVRCNTSLGIKAKFYVEKQLWIPNELVIDALRQRFERGDFQEGILFDGFPGDIEQARLLDWLIELLGVKLTAIIQLVVPDEICIDRSMKRRVCKTCGDGFQQAEVSSDFPETCAQCGNKLFKRSDDIKGIFEERLKSYRYRMNDVMEYYDIEHRLKVISVNGKAQEEDVWRKVKSHIEATQE